MKIKQQYEEEISRLHKLIEQQHISPSTQQQNPTPHSTTQPAHEEKPAQQPQQTSTSKDSADWGVVNIVYLLHC